MSTEAVARRYATAVFELARESEELEAVASELGEFARIYAENDDFRLAVSSPRLAEADRTMIVSEIAKRLKATSITTRTVSLLTTRQRLAILPDLVRVLNEQTDEHLGIVRAHVRGATRLSRRYLDRLQKRIEKATGKKAVLTFEEDPSLIAGVVTQIGDRVVDGSIRGKLDQLAESLRQT